MFKMNRLFKSPVHLAHSLLAYKGGQKDPDWFDSSWVLADGGQVESGGEVRNRSETNLKTLGSSLHESSLKSSVATIYTTVR